MSIRESLNFDVIGELVYEDSPFGSLFMAQSVDGIHAGGFEGREISEDYTHCSGKEKGDNDDGDVRGKGDGQHFCGAKGGGQGQDNAEYTAKGGEHYSFHQKLEQHFMLIGTDGQADADFPGAFGHGYQHDVHDADAADQKTYCGHRNKKGGHGFGGGGEHGGQLLGIHDPEVVLFIVGEVAAFS